MSYNINTKSETELIILENVVLRINKALSTITNTKNTSVKIGQNEKIVLTEIYKMLTDCKYEYDLVMNTKCRHIHNADCWKLESTTPRLCGRNCNCDCLTNENCDVYGQVNYNYNTITCNHTKCDCLPQLILDISHIM